MITVIIALILSILSLLVAVGAYCLADSMVRRQDNERHESRLRKLEFIMLPPVSTLSINTADGKEALKNALSAK